MPFSVDALIVGGGATGLWLRALLKAYGRSVVLIESQALGSGQTIASQGILHSGAKYAARTSGIGVFHALPAMAFAWRQHLAGENIPDLRGTEIITNETWYWNPGGPLPACLENWCRRSLSGDDHAGETPTPEPLRQCRGRFGNRQERSLCPESLLRILAGGQQADLLQVPADNVHWQVAGPGEVTSVTLRSPAGGEELTLRPRRVFLTAGAGNAALREAVGLAGAALMQQRPLRMGLLRGTLPRLCGHWFDERGPRLTVSTHFDRTGRTIWQLGGRLAEDPQQHSPESFLPQARKELLAALPGLDLSLMEWSSYEAVRAEPNLGNGGVPDDVGILSEGNVITLWPTKLTLLPYLMIDIRRALDAGDPRSASLPLDLPEWPHPPVAQPPWETAAHWVPDAAIADAPG